MPPLSETSSVLIHSLRAMPMIELAIEKGLDLNTVIQDTNISAREFHDRQLKITAAQYGKIVQNLLPHFHNTSFALEYGARLNITSRGPVSLLIMSLPNLMEVVKFSVTYQRLLDVPHLGHYYQTESGLAIEIESKAHPMYSAAFWRFNAETLMASFFVSANYLNNATIPLLGMKFNYSEPAYSQAYQDLFQCPIEFDAETCTMIFPNEVLNKPLMTANETLARDGQEIYQKHLNKHLQSTPVSRRVTSLLSESLGDYPELKEMANKLSMNERTLRRKLAEEGTSFQTILDATRQTHAKRLLRSNSGSVEYIAISLGFSDASSFRKAFKRWTGKTPIEYRKTHSSADTSEAEEEKS